MARQHDLIYGIKKLLKNSNQGSFQTKNKREIELTQMTKDLAAGGFKLQHMEGLKPKHVDYLNELWRSRGLSAGTIKNKNTQLRWWATMVNKAGMIKSNDELGLEKRCYIPKKSKAIELSNIQLNQINDKYIEASLRLQCHLGLRREESMKIQPHIADKGDYLELKGSWCKGGRSRVVPVLTQEAREAIDFAKSVVKTKQDSLIPRDKTYLAQKHYYEYKTSEANIKNPHGLRHAYAQQRYKILTNWECPLNGGTAQKNLSAEDRRKDYEARLTISEELGHSRVNITTNYLGR